MKTGILSLLLSANIFYCWSQVSLKAINLESGPYAVGFSHYLTTDSSRSYKRIFDWNNDYIPRPIPVSVWYPAIAPQDKGATLTVLDYLAILKEEEEWEHLPNDRILNWFYYQNTEQNQKHLAERSIAFADAVPIGSKHPLIVYAPSYQASSIENFALCEFLASHGYMVIASPSRGAESRFLEGGTEKDMDAQARDIEFLIAQASKINNVDYDRIGTIGFSFGGLSNVLAQNRNRQIKLIVSLDGSIRYQYTTFKKSPYASVEKVDVPFIHMAQKNIPKEVIEEDKLDPSLNTSFDFYDDLVHSTAYSYQFNNLTHPYFSSLGVLFQQRDNRQDKNDVEIMESYKWLSIYTLHSLNAFLKDDKKSLAFLDDKPENKDMKAGLLRMKHKNPQLRDFSFEDFNTRAKASNYSDLENLYQELLKEHPYFTPKEDQLNNLGLQLTFNPQGTQQGINVLCLATVIYPASANLFDSLAEAYLFAGDKSSAAINFKKSLELYPENENAKKRLEKLEGTR